MGALLFRHDPILKLKLRSLFSKGRSRFVGWAIVGVKGRSTFLGGGRSLWGKRAIAREGAIGFWGGAINFWGKGAICFVCEGRSLFSPNVIRDRKKTKPGVNFEKDQLRRQGYSNSSTSVPMLHSLLLANQTVYSNSASTARST